MHLLKKTGTSSFTVIAYDIGVNDGRIERNVHAQFDDLSVEKAASILETRSVDADEIDVALMEMEKNEHNTASFGVFGKLTCTLYEGVLQ